MLILFGLFATVAIIVKLDVLSALDSQLLLAVGSSSSEPLLFAAVLVSDLGGLALWVLLSLGLWVFGGEYHKRSAVLLALTIGVAAVLRWLVGIPVYRSRPLEFASFPAALLSVEAGSSFPSGHATRAIASASILTHRYGLKASPLVAFALLVAASRTILSLHYPLDVLGGLFLGLAVAEAIHLFRKSLDGVTASLTGAWAFLEPRMTKFAAVLALSYATAWFFNSLFILRSFTLEALAYNIRLLTESDSLLPGFGALQTWPVVLAAAVVFPLVSLVIVGVGWLLLQGPKSVFRVIVHKAANFLVIASVLPVMWVFAAALTAKRTEFLSWISLAIIGVGTAPHRVSLTVLSWIRRYGVIGVLGGMFLESSIVPVPSELILVAAGAAGLNIFHVSILGAVGSTLGSIIGWAVGLYGGRPAVRRWGKYILVREREVNRAQQWFAKWGGLAILASRLIPIVPYKVFSITSGILRYPLKQFVLFTFIGTVPRAFILAWIGVQLVEVGYELLLAAVLVVIVVLALWTVVKLLRRPKP